MAAIVTLKSDTAPGVRENKKKRSGGPLRYFC